MTATALWLLAQYGQFAAAGGGGLAFLGGLLDGWKKWAAIGAGLLIVIVYVLWLKLDLAEQKATIAEQKATIQVVSEQRATAIAVAEVNALAVEATRLSGQRAMAAIRASHATSLAVAAASRIVEKEIANVPEAQNCVLGPDARRVIDRLWNAR